MRKWAVMGLWLVAAAAACASKVKGADATVPCGPVDCDGGQYCCDPQCGLCVASEVACIDTCGTGPASSTTGVTATGAGGSTASSASGMAASGAGGH